MTLAVLPLAPDPPGTGEVARVVARGLSSPRKRLPPWLFYDARGSALFEQITALPEYYLTRAERAIFARDGLAIIDAVMGDEPATIVELGAGTAVKTDLLLAAARVRRGRVHYVPTDISPEPLAQARARLALTEPSITVTPWVATHEQVFVRLRDLPGRKVVLFCGSSIGNYEPPAAHRLLRGLRHGLDRGDVLVLGTDLRKSPAEMVAAYADAAGVTPAFNRNLLTRLNRELGADFEVSRFDHLARWNPARSRIEMHLESRGDQRVTIERCGIAVGFRDGERIHTESSIKYDDAMADAMLARAGFVAQPSFGDRADGYAVRIARVPRGP